MSSTNAPSASAAPAPAPVAPKKLAQVAPQIKPATAATVVPLKTQVLTAPAAAVKPVSVAPATTAASRRPSIVSSSAASASTGRSTTSKSKKKKSNPAVTMATAPGGGGGAASGGGAQGENTGRWTAEEHRLFLQGLEQHGKGWKKIASLIKSRTVVQIRTHAQKYFQKLAKARQNGEEGEVTMEGRGGVGHAGAGVVGVGAGHHDSGHAHPGAGAVGGVGGNNAVGAAGTGPAAANKRRRQITGTKRKVIQSVVTSAHRQGKKLAAGQASAGVPNPVPPLPAVAPALAHFVMPQSSTSLAATAASQGNVSGPALEDSLFRFLTPISVGGASETADVARQAGANPITLPSSNPSAAPTAVGETSPTGVQDFNNLYPSWTDAKDPPSWYAKGADVDALLDVADTLDWLADTGDLNETYQPTTDGAATTTTTSTAPASATAAALSDASAAAKTTTSPRSDLGTSATTGVSSTSTDTLPHVDSNVDTVVPPLPSLFGSSAKTTSAVATDPTGAGSLLDDAEDGNKLVASALASHPSDPDMQHLLGSEVFDTPMEEHDFVSTILETKSTDNLQNLQ